MHHLVIGLHRSRELLPVPLYRTDMYRHISDIGMSSLSWGHDGNYYGSEYLTYYWTVEAMRCLASAVSGVRKAGVVPGEKRGGTGQAPAVALVLSLSLKPLIGGEAS